MASKPFKVSFSIDEEDAAYFRGLFRKARQHAAEQDRAEILKGARELLESVRKSKKTPNFVLEAMATLEDLTQIIEDEDYRAPKAVSNQVLGALAYFGNPEDLIPDHIPVLGFLDDAIMIKFVEDEFKHELRAYRKFRRFREGAEQRPWTKVAKGRLPGRLEAQRQKLREEVERKKASDTSRGAIGL
jgi:uncharacterized membrane protein YkvA (DUF1232 family)